jgi:DhnA family fructose-bisphosphate aldolase class Ia
MVSDPPAQASPPFDVADKIRIAAELGADLIKIGIPTTIGTDLAAKLQRTLRSAPPVLLAGGERAEPLLPRLRAAVALGVAGTCIGRHVFQADSPQIAVNEILGAWDGT